MQQAEDLRTTQSGKPVCCWCARMTAFDGRKKENPLHPASLRGSVNLCRTTGLFCLLQEVSLRGQLVENYPQERSSKTWLTSQMTTWQLKTSDANVTFEPVCTSGAMYCTVPTCHWDNRATQEVAFELRAQSRRHRTQKENMKLYNHTASDSHRSRRRKVGAIEFGNQYRTAEFFECAVDEGA